MPLMNSKCRVCHSESGTPVFYGQIQGRYVAYFECHSCAYVQTEEPTWLDEAYADTINQSDTGIMARNQANVSLVLSTLALIGDMSGRVVDYAGGYGFLVRMLRDRGVDALWADPYSENLVAKGFEYSAGGAALVTAFEAFEHFVNPVQEMERLLSISSTILLTTNVIPSPTPQPNEWWYYGLDHGQHIGFYRRQTFEYLARKFDLNFLSDGSSTHLYSKRKLSYSKWQMVMKISRMNSRMFSIGLKSKTWEDYLAMSKFSQIRW
jgi:hypothetical protein